MVGHVLVVDDDPDMRALLDATLTKRGFTVSSADGPNRALDMLRADPAIDVVVTDLNMDEMDGIELCERTMAEVGNLPVIVITAHGSMEAAVHALRARAFDFLTKPFDLDAFTGVVESALRHRVATGPVPTPVPVAVGHEALAPLLGESPSMRELKALVARVADVEAPVLTVGESGTGKELIARALHKMSKSKSGPFVAVNCAAIPESLLEGELFGHVRGAFTDARTDRRGLFEQANGGTLFLDEIGELDLKLQPKLLRALQTRSIRPVGGDREVPVDVRVISATNQPLAMLVRERRFREDLYYRLNVIEVHIPPLRERGLDILLCAERFLQRFAKEAGKDLIGFTESARERLLSHDWPGNVRELENAILRAVALSRGPEIGVEDLPDSLKRSTRRTTRATESQDTLLRLEEIERRHILRVLEATGGNKTLAAQILGVDRRTLYRKDLSGPKTSVAKT
jgi:two-component system response regulator AtoC